MSQSGSLSVFYCDGGLYHWSSSGRELIDPDATKTCSVTNDVNGKMHIAYVASNQLKYATLEGSMWLVETLCPAVQNSYTDIAVDSYNNIHISYYDGHVKYANNINGSWLFITPDTSSIGVYNSIALGSSHRIWIAYDGGGSFKKATMIMPYPAATVPSEVNNLELVSGDSQITLSWFAPDFFGNAPLTYSIYRSTSTGAEVLLTTSTSRTYLDTGLTPGVTYYYRVTAVNSAGEGPMSSEASMIAPTLPSAPLGLQVISGDQQVILSWSAPSSDGYSAIT
jgi:hypothetical protein